MARGGGARIKEQGGGGISSFVSFTFSIVDTFFPRVKRR